MADTQDDIDDRNISTIVDGIRHYHRYPKDIDLAGTLFTDLKTLDPDTLGALALALTAYKRAALGTQYGMAVSTMEHSGVSIEKP
jgi:hypothetical protein